MTVANLKEILSQYPDDLSVIADGQDGWVRLREEVIYIVKTSRIDGLVTHNNQAVEALAIWQ